MKYFTISRYFGPETSSRSIESKNYGAYPELQKLGLSAEQTRARAKAIAKMDEYINDDTKFSRGKDAAGIASFAKHLMTLDSTRQGIQKQMWELKRMLLTEKNPNWSEQIETHLNTINPDGTANLEMTDTKMSRRMFLQKIVGAFETAKILVAPNETVTLNDTQIKQKTRLETFLLSLETEKDGLFGATWKARTGQDGIQRQILYTRKLLRENKIKEALNYAQKNFDNKWNGVTIGSIIATDGGLMQAQRAMKDTGAASATAMKSIKENIAEWESEKLKSLKAEITTEKLEVSKESYYSKAAEMLKNTIESLPMNDPDRLDMQRRESEYLDTLKVGLALEAKIGDFIKKNGSDGLGDILEQYNDMKGLYGAFNFTDENARLVKEIALIVGSMVVTMGASAVLGSAAAAARVGVAANAGRTTRIAHAWARMVAPVANASRTNVATAAITDSMVFTTAETLLSKTFNIEGKNSNFFDTAFIDKLATNTVMFGAFSGVERALGSAFFAKIPVLKNLAVSPETPILYKWLKFAAGDLAVMQALHAAETGKIEFDILAVAPILIFRAGPAVVKNYFPNLYNKFTGLPKAEQEKLSNNASTANNSAPKNSANISTRKMNVREFPKEVVARREEFLKSLENPKRGDIVKMPDGSEWRYTAMDESWQKLMPGKTWFNMDYTMGTQMTTKQLRREYLPQLRNTSLQNSIDDALGINRNQKMTADDFLSADEIITQKTKLQEAREKIASGPEKIDEKIFKNFEENREYENLMKNSKSGTEIRLKIDDGSGEPGGFARYIKQSDGKWKHTESNVSATSLVDDFLHTYVNKNKVFLDKEKKLQIEEISIYTPRDTRLAELDRLIAQSDSNLVKNPKNSALSQQKYEYVAWENYPLIPYNPKFAAQLKNASPQKLLDDLSQVSPKAGDDINNAIKDATEGNPTKLQNFFQNHWKSITSGVVGLGILREIFDRKKTNPFAILPEKFPTDPQAAFEQCMACFRDQEDPADINFDRPSTANNRVILDKDRREDISHRWMKTTKWQELMSEWDDLMDQMPESERKNVQFLRQKMDAIRKNPTVELVQELQKCIDMEKTDDPIGQDGILGPNTTQKISEFIHNCRIKYIELTSEWHDQLVTKDASVENVSSNNAIENPIVEPRSDVDTSTANQNAVTDGASTPQESNDQLPEWATQDANGNVFYPVKKVVNSQNTDLPNISE